MIIKMLVITSMMLSASVRSPQQDTNPYDYEFRAGIQGFTHPKDFETGDNIKFMANILFEREEGRQGTGHDLFIKQYLSLNINEKDYKLQNQFTSYNREVKKMNLQTLDSSIIHIINRNELGAGLSIAGDYSREASLYLYFSFENNYIDAGYRTNFEKNIYNLRLRYDYPINENILIRPSLVYLDNNGKKDYQGMVSLMFMLQRTKEVK
jgi:hypothetical protein